MTGTAEIVPVRTADYPELVAVWEASVRATHDFLGEQDIAFFKPLLLSDYLPAVRLACTKTAAGAISGFVGVAENKIEMLFIDPARRGQGLGKTLLDYAVTELGADKVDVNEQNAQAVGFYRHLGFRTVARSPLDGSGKPFPLLHMALA